MNLFELSAKIGVDDSDFNKGIGKARKGFGDFSAWTIAKGQLIADAIKASGKAFLDLGKQAINSFAEYEQLAGGAQKIFNDMDYSKIATDANNAYKELGLSANQYLAVINDVGATFAATMGDEAGYEAAKTGLKAISDYASGTGKNVDELSQKFTLITRSTSSYQSIADQFSGILPATSDAFLEQAQAAGILSDNYTKLTEVPIDEYQAAVSQMLQQGVADLGLANNTMNEAFSTLSGSLSMAKGAWSNLVTGLADDSADLDMLIGNFVESVGAVATQLIPKIGTALNGASKLVRDLIPVIVQEIPVLIEENLPILARAAVGIVESLVKGISQNQKKLMKTASQTISYLVKSFVKLLPEIIELGLEILVSLAEGISENLKELVPTIVDVVIKIVNTLTNPQTLSRLFVAALQIVETLAETLLRDDVLDNLIDAAVQIIISIADFITNNIDKLFNVAVEIIEALLEYLTDPKNLAKLAVAAGEIIMSLGKAFGSAVEGLSAGIAEVIAWIVKRFTGIDLTEAGKETMKTFIMGMLGVAKANSVADAVKNFAGEHARNIVAGEIDEYNIDGSHRFGLDYVPYDGYIAQLHKGEKVLTASEARNQDKYDSRNVNVSITIDENVNAMGLARELLPFLKIAAQEAYA